MKKEDLFDLCVSQSEKDFVNYGLSKELHVASNLLEELSNFPYIGSLIKLGQITNKYLEYKFIRKLARFLNKEQKIPEKDKKRFLNSITTSQRQKINDYVMHYLLNAEDEDKAELIGYVFCERVCNNIDDKMFLRLSSIINNSFVSDLKSLPQYVQKSENRSVEANNFICLGLIDNYVGGYWTDGPSWELNEIGITLYNILNNNNWFDKSL